MRHFARECRAPRSKDNRNWNQGTSSKALKIEDASEKAMCAIDDSEVTNDKSYSKSCLKNYEALKKQYDDLLVKLDDTGFKASTYKRGHKEYQMGLLRTKLEKVKQEKEGFEFKIAKFEKSAKDLDQMLESQITDKSKKGVGYHAVPSPHPLILNRPTPLDLSYSGLEEFKQPEVNEYGPRDSSLKPTTGCDKESDNSKENTDDSLKQQQKTDSKTSSVKSPLKADKDWKEKFFSPANHVKEVEPKKVRENNDAPIIEDWVSDDEDEVEPIPKVEKKIVIPAATKKEFVKSETPVRRSVRHVLSVEVLITFNTAVVVPSPHPLILNRPTPLDLSYSGLEEFKQPEVNEYSSRDSSLKPTTVCDRESDNSKENTDDSLKQQHKTVTETSSVKSPLKVDKDWKEKFFYPANHVREEEPKKARENNDAPIIEDWVSDDEEEVEPIPKVEKKTAIPTATKKESVKPEKPIRRSIRYAEMYRSQGPRGNQRNWNGQKSNQLGCNFVFNNKACFICGSFDHIQYNCPNAHKHMVPRAVLMKTGLKTVNNARPVNTVRSVNTARPFSTARAFNTVRPSYTAHPKSTVLCARPKKHFQNQAQSTVQRPFYKKTSLTKRSNNQNINTGRQTVNTVRPNVNTIRARGFNAVKPSACWVWRPIKPNGASLSNSQLNDKGFVDSGCSRHMSGNIAHLLDFKDFDGGYVTFGGGENGGRITGKVVAGTFSNDSAGIQGVSKSSTSSQQDQDCIVMPIWKDASYFDDASLKSVADAQIQDQDGTHDDCSLQNNGTADQQVNTASPEVKTGSREVSTVVPEVNIATPEDFMGPIPTSEDTQVEDQEIELGNISPSYAVYKEFLSLVHLLNKIKIALYMPIWKDASYFGNNAPRSVADAPLQDKDRYEKHENDATKTSRLKRESLEIMYSLINKLILPAQKLILVVEMLVLLSPEAFNMAKTPEYVGRDPSGYASESSVQTRRMTSSYSELGFLSAIYEGKTHKDLHTCLFSCFFSQEEPKRVSKALSDPTWVEAMQEELLQFKLKRSDQPDKVYTVVKSIYVNCIKHPELGPTKKKGIFISQDKYVHEILRKYNYTDVKSASTPTDLEKPLVQDGDAADVDEQLIYQCRIFKVPYTTSRPDIMFASRHVSKVSMYSPKTSPSFSSTQDRKSTTKAEYVLLLQIVGGQVSLDSKPTAGLRSAEATTDDNGEVQITATIDGHSMSITEASLRRHLKLDDHDGITSIPNSEIFEQLALMGYHTDSDKLTFQKGAFFTSMEELDELVTKLSERIGVLEDDLRKTKKTYNSAFTKLILKVKKLEARVKIGKARKRAKVVLSEDDEDVEDEFLSKQVTPTEVIQDQESSEKGSAGATKGTASEVPVNKGTYCNNKEILLDMDEEERQRAMSEAKSTKKINWNDPSVIRYHALKMKPKTIAQARRNMIKYLKNQGNYKISDFKGMSYNEIS
ncbi:hypothetical protein Tco_0829326 [Tanacetum coccineum]